MISPLDPIFDAQYISIVVAEKSMGVVQFSPCIPKSYHGFFPMNSPQYSRTATFEVVGCARSKQDIAVSRKEKRVFIPMDFDIPMISP
jgi:hypothetical protein